jgi:hypothetical protein
MRWLSGRAGFEQPTHGVEIRKIDLDYWRNSNQSGMTVGPMPFDDLVNRLLS